MVKKIAMTVMFIVATCMSANYVPGEVLVRFTPGIVTPMIGTQKHGLEKIIESGIHDLLLRYDISCIQRAIPNFAPAETITILENSTKVRVQDFSQVYLLSFPISVDVTLICSELNKLAGVTWAEPNFIYQLNYPNDPRFIEQWALNSSGPYDINCSNAWNMEKGKQDVKIAIIDCGIKYDHPDLGGGYGIGYKVRGGYDYVDQDQYPYDPGTDPHGTHVAGIASALTNNSIGVSGISGGWGGSGIGCLLYAFRCGTGGDISGAAAIDAIISAAKPVAQGGYGCRVINNSWGGYGAYNGLPSESMREALIYAFTCFRTLVASKGDSHGMEMHWPSDYEHHLVVSVGASDHNGNRCSWSNYGNDMDVIAPGENILSTFMPSGTDMYAFKQGTSMAAPHVSGLASLIYSEAIDQSISLQSAEVEGIISASAIDVGTPGYDSQNGWGIINAEMALKYLHYPYHSDKFCHYWNNNYSFELKPLFNNKINVKNHPIIPDGTYDCFECRKLIMPLPEPPRRYVEPYLHGLPGEYIGGSGTIGYSYTPYFNSVEGMLLYNYALHCEPYAMTKKINGQWWGYTYTYRINTPVGEMWIPDHPVNCRIFYAVIAAFLISPDFKDITFPNPSTMKLRWLYQHGVEAGFRVQKKINGGSWTLLPITVPPNQSPGLLNVYYEDTDFTEGNIYAYRVYSVNGAGDYYYSDYSQELNRYAIKLPTNLIVTLTSPTTVSLAWTDNSMIEYEFQVARKIDNGTWNDNYKSVPAAPGSGSLVSTNDNIEVLHNYTYRVRAVHNYGNSDWSNEYTITGVLAQSNYSKMSSFNSNCKVSLDSDGKIHIIYFDGTWIRYSFSTDNGGSFLPWENVAVADTLPALALDKNGIPFVVYGINMYVGGYDPPYRVRYYVGKRIQSGWQFSYHPIYNSDYTVLTTMPCPPSLTISNDSGYVAFRDAVTGAVKACGFPLEINGSPNGVTVAANGVCYPVIGFDNIYSRKPRIIIVARNSDDGKAYLHWRYCGNTNWNTVDLSGASEALGAPSMWTGVNEFRVSYEGWYNDNAYIISRRLTWTGNNYSPQNLEMVVQDAFDYHDYSVEGYTYLPASNVILWQYNHDIYYAKYSGSWGPAINLSETSEQLSSYPQGITFTSELASKLLGVWTERIGTNYSLIRKIVTIDNLPQNPDNVWSQKSLQQFTISVSAVTSNPVIDKIIIHYNVTKTCRVKANLYDVCGRLIRSLFNGTSSAGMNEFSSNTQGIASGIYFLSVEAGSRVVTKKIVIQH